MRHLPVAGALAVIAEADCGMFESRGRISFLIPTRSLSITENRLLAFPHLPHIR